MPRPLPRLLSSSLPPPSRRAYTPSLDDEPEADDYFQDRGRGRGRRSSHPGQSYDYDSESRRRAESANCRIYRPSSEEPYHRPKSSTRYRDEEDEDRGRERSQRRDSYRPSKSLDGPGRSNRRRFTSRSSSTSSSSYLPASSRSSSTDSSLSSHHYGARHRRRSSTNPQKGQKKNDRYYPPSASRTSRSTRPPQDTNTKRTPLNRLRSLSLPAVASKLNPHSRSRSSSRSPSRSRSRGRSKTKSSNSQPPEKRSPSQIFIRAAQTFAEAGAIAALKLRDDPSPWIGPNGKAPKIAAAALSAAAVDTFMEHKHPKRKGGIRHTVMRQVTQMAIGNLVKKAPVEAVVPPVMVKSGKVHGGKAGRGAGKAAGHHAGGGGKGGRVHTGGGGGRGRR